jgi:hypothetical protein
LIGIAECSRYLYNYNHAIILLKKGLQYAWKIKDEDKEIEIYDLIGKNHYLNGDINKA